MLASNVLDEKKNIAGSKTDRGRDSQRDTIEGLVAQFNSDTILNDHDGTATKTHRTLEHDGQPMILASSDDKKSIINRLRSQEQIVFDNCSLNTSKRSRTRSRGTKKLFKSTTNTKQMSITKPVLSQKSLDSQDQSWVWEQKKKHLSRKFHSLKINPP